MQIQSLSKIVSSLSDRVTDKPLDRIHLSSNTKFLICNCSQNRICAFKMDFVSLKAYCMGPVNIRGPATVLLALSRQMALELVKRDELGLAVSTVYGTPSFVSREIVDYEHITHILGVMAHGLRVTMSNIAFRKLHLHLVNEWVTQWS